MNRILSILVLLALCPAATSAVPIRTPHYAEVPTREFSESRDLCHLRYYNRCSQWTWSWNMYGFGEFMDFDVQYGTCFDLADCPGHCRHLEDVWWAAGTWDWYAVVDVEIYRADENDCPVGAPLAGIYNDTIYRLSSWQYFAFGGLPLCECEDGTGKFIVAISLDHEWVWPYSDVNHRNIAAGCESDWRCSGHSYVYRNVVSYCEAYGGPGALWVDGPDYGCTNYPTIPPGCHNYFWDTGYFSEWLIVCYISCHGATATEETSWSEIKGMYR